MADIEIYCNPCSEEGRIAELKLRRPFFKNFFYRIFIDSSIDIRYLHCHVHGYRGRVDRTNKSLIQSD